MNKLLGMIFALALASCGSVPEYPIYKIGTCVKVLATNKACHPNKAKITGYVYLESYKFLYMLEPYPPAANKGCFYAPVAESAIVDVMKCGGGWK